MKTNFSFNGYLKSIVRISLLLIINMSQVLQAQDLTTPQVVGQPSGRRMTTPMPFDIKGIAFSEIRNSVWSPQSEIVSEFQVTYYREGDPKQYVNKSITKVSLAPYGNWQLQNLYVEPLPYHKPNVKLVAGKTEYSLFIYQLYQGRKSALWNAAIEIDDYKKWKTPKDITSGPIIVHPKDKVILNPQPIPPKTPIKKKLIIK